MFAECLGGFQAVHLRHVDIHENRVVLPFGGPCDGLSSGVGDVDVGTRALQELERQLLIDRVVLGDEYVFALQQANGPLLGVLAAFGHFCFGARKTNECRKGEAAAGPHLGLYLNRSAHHFHEAFADGQPQTGAAEAPGGRRFGLLEGFEQAFLLILADAEAGIGNRHLDQQTFGALLLDVGDDANLAVFGEFQRVAHQVDQHLLYPQRIADNDAVFGECGAVGRAIFDLQGDTFAAQFRTKQPLHIGESVNELERSLFERQFAGLDLGEIEYVAHQALQILGCVANGGQVLVLFTVEAGLQREFGKPHDGVHGRSDLVAHVGKELAFRLGSGFGDLPVLVGQLPLHAF